MQLTNVARAGIKQHIVMIIITVIFTSAYWGAGFWAMGQPDWGGGLDRLIYIDAANHFFRHENLYVEINQPLPENLIFYNYPPLAVFWVGLLSSLPPAVLYGLHFAAVVALFLVWKRIFQKIQLDIPTWILPFWFVYSPFVYDAVTLNINVFLALLATVYLWFSLEEDRLRRLGAVLPLFLMIATKPQWGFFALLPLVQRKWKTFLQLVSGVVVLYLLIWGLASLLTSPGYVLDQHRLFIQHLGTFTGRFTYWNLPPGPYQYNNSLHQVAIYLMGNVKAGLAAAGYVQLGLFALLAVLFVRTTRDTTRGDSGIESLKTLQWFFILYCATLLFPPLNFDFSLGPPMFLFVAAQGRLRAILLAVPLLFIAFQDTLSVLLSSGWFPFVFAAAVISLIFLLIMKPHSVHARQGTL